MEAVMTAGGSVDLTQAPDRTVGAAKLFRIPIEDAKAKPMADALAVSVFVDQNGRRWWDQISPSDLPHGFRGAEDLERVVAKIKDGCAVEQLQSKHPANA